MICIMLLITSLVFTYLVTESLYLLTTFINSPSLLPTSGNHKSYLFFYECVFEI